MTDFIVNIAAYKFCPLDDLPRRRQHLLSLCERLALRGTILLAAEGINLFLAGTRTAIDEFLTALGSEPALADMEVKKSLSGEQPFNRMLVKIKKEIIAFGIDGIDPARHASPRVSAAELKSWLDAGKPVRLLDVRNDMEFEVGTFAGAQPIGIADFRDFPNAVGQLPASMRDEVVVTFCTGGIRCEKAAPYMEQQGFRHVYQLDGGILKYFEECDGAHYDGDCFVFDKRVALDPSLHETVTAQCYACQAILTPAESLAPEYEYGVSCPRCYKSIEERMAELIERRHAAIRAVTEPLPGLEPYENIRPVHVPGAFDGQTAIDFLCGQCRGVSRQTWLAELKRGRIRRRYGGSMISLSAEDTVRAGQRLEHTIPNTVEPAAAVDIRVLFEDEALVVVNKPAPLPMHPSGRYNRHSLQWIFSQVYAHIRLRCVHRLDANTSGVVVFCKKRALATNVQQQFERREVEKRYLARVSGHPIEDQFASDAAISVAPDQVGTRRPDPAGLPARTEFRVLKREPAGTSLVEAQPVTGRTNQIRIHLWDLDMPVVGDPLYLPNRRIGRTQTLAADAPPMCLHAWSIRLRHPVSGDMVSFESPLPDWAAES